MIKTRFINNVTCIINNVLSINSSCGRGLVYIKRKKNYFLFRFLFCGLFGGRGMLGFLRVLK